MEIDDRNDKDYSDRNLDPGMVVDYQTRKKLKKAERGIKKNIQMAYISFLLEFVVFIILIAVWASLSST